MLQRSTFLFLLFFVGACESTGTMSARPRRNPDAMLQLSMDDMMRPDLAEELPPEEDLKGVDLLGVPPRDLSMIPRDMATVVSTECTVVVNEVVTATKDSASEEWIEIYNPCSTSQNLSGWSLLYRSAGNNGGANNADVVLVDNLSNTINPGQYFLWAGSGYNGTKNGSFKQGLGLSDDGGGVALADPDYIIDCVAYGSANSNHNYIEGAKTAAAPRDPRPGKSIARVPNGTDTDDNSSDFQVATPTPRAPN